jgi:hypothetical protein
VIAVRNLSVVTLMNDEVSYGRTVASLRWQAPEGFFQFLPVHADREGWNAAQGLNHGIRAAISEWVLLVHQDVVFPDGWLTRFATQIDALPATVAVVGIVGYSLHGTYMGHIRDPHGHMKRGDLPCRAMSLDEVLIAVRKTSGLRFDVSNPGFLFYGTDICLTARARGLQAMVIDAPVIHLSAGRRDTPYDAAAHWLLSKWGPSYGNLIATPTMLVGTPRPSSLRRWLRVRVDAWLNRVTARAECRCADAQDPELSEPDVP